MMLFLVLLVATTLSQGFGSEKVTPRPLKSRRLRSDEDLLSFEINPKMNKSLVTLSTSKDGIFCTGFFVRKNFIVTSTSCVANKPTESLNLALYRNDRIVVKFLATEIVYRTNWSKFYQNLALIKVDLPKGVDVDIYDQAKEPRSKTIGLPGAFYSWQLPKPETLEPEMLKSQMFTGTIISKEICSSEYQVSINDTIVCVVFVPRKEKLPFRKEDCGGPLIVQFPGDSRSYFIGMYPGRSESKKDYLVAFEDAYHNYEWINAVMTKFL